VQIERRAFLRAPIEEWKAEITAGQSQIVGQVRNVSAQGVAIECRTSVAPGTSCCVKLASGDGLDIEAIGRVAHEDPTASGFRLGIDFTRIAPEDYQFLQNLAYTHAPGVELVAQPK
jgi:hypothetical protein